MSLKQITVNGWLKDVNDNFAELDNPAGETYYVDGNAGNDVNSGASWDSAYKTLAVALAASHANIAASSKGWAARNRIYCKGDSFEEDLTKLAQKTDVIGVGSCDYLAGARLIGNHEIISTVSYMGCRFIGFNFQAGAEGGDIFTFADGAIDQAGIAFIGCTFDAASTVVASAAIVGAAMPNLTIRGCMFTGDFSDAVIELGAGYYGQLLIAENFIHGANAGIEVNAAAVFSGHEALIKDNVIVTSSASDVALNDASGLAYVVGNRVFSGAEKGTGGDGIIVAGTGMAQDNRISGSNVANAVVPAQGSL